MAFHVLKKKIVYGVMVRSVNPEKHIRQMTVVSYNTSSCKKVSLHVQKWLHG